MNKYERYELSRPMPMPKVLGEVTCVDDLYIGARVWDSHYWEYGTITNVSTHNGNIDWECPSGPNGSGLSYFTGGHHIAPSDR